MTCARQGCGRKQFFGIFVLYRTHLEAAEEEMLFCQTNNRDDANTNATATNNSY